MAYVLQPVMFQFPGGTTNSVPGASPVWTNHAGVPLPIASPRGRSVQSSPSGSPTRLRRPTPPPCPPPEARASSDSSASISASSPPAVAGSGCPPPRCQCAGEPSRHSGPGIFGRHLYALHRKRRRAAKSALRGKPRRISHPQLLTHVRGCDRRLRRATLRARPDRGGNARVGRPCAGQDRSDRLAGHSRVFRRHPLRQGPQLRAARGGLRRSCTRSKPGGSASRTRVHSVPPGRFEQNVDPTVAALAPLRHAFEAWLDPPRHQRALTRRPRPRDP